MSAVLDFPVIDLPAAGGAVAKIDLKALALSRFGEWKPEAEKVVAKYKGVIFDATTPKGYKSLTEAIAEVRAPRYAAQNVSKASKSELAAVSKAVGAEEAAVAAFLEATEAELVAQKDAEDARRAEEAERQRVAEAARVAGFNAKIAAIRECVTKARGLTSERIAKGIQIVEGFSFSTEEWQEFAVSAANAQCGTLEAMRALHAQALTDEAAAVAAQAEKDRLARVAEEQRIEAARLQEARDMIAKAEREAAEARAAFERERAEFMAAQEAAKPKMDAPQAGPVGDGSQKPDDGVAIPAAEAGSDNEAAPYRASFEDAQSEIMGIQQQVFIATSGRLGVRVGGTIECIRATLAETEALTIGDHLHIFKGAAQKAKDEAVAKIRALLVSAEADVAGQPADAGAAEEPTLALGDIKDRIAPLSITAEGLAQLGFPHVATKGAAKLYLPSTWPAMRAAMVKMIEAT